MRGAWRGGFLPSGPRRSGIGSKRCGAAWGRVFEFLFFSRPPRPPLPPPRWGGGGGRRSNRGGGESPETQIVEPASGARERTAAVARAMTSLQSPIVVWRNRRAAGYQGLVSR